MSKRPLFQPGEPVWDMTENPRKADVVVEPRYMSGRELALTLEGGLGIPVPGWWYRLEAKPRTLVHESALRRRPPPANKSLAEIIGERKPVTA